MNIALYGRSGAGKSSVADVLVAEYGFVKCSSGAVCRQVCLSLFKSESKTLLNEVTDALKAVDENVWLRAAISANVEGKPAVFDSMRFVGDYRFLTERAFTTWKIVAPLEVRLARLRARGQSFDPEVDEFHRGETELESHHFDVVIDNSSSDLSALYDSIRTALARQQ